MSVQLDGTLVRLEGDCHVEDAEALLRLVVANEGAAADLSQCRHLHGAVLQVLLAFRTPVAVGPLDPFLRDQVAANLEQAAASGEKK